MAFDIIEEVQRKEKLYILKTPKTEEIRKYDLGSSPDPKNYWNRELHNYHMKLMFLSNDKGARILARNFRMPVVEI